MGQPGLSGDLEFYAARGEVPIVKTDELKHTLYLVKWTSRLGGSGGQLSPVPRQFAEYLVNLFSERFDDYHYWLEPVSGSSASGPCGRPLPF